MKKYISIILTIMVILSLVGCTKKKVEQNNQTDVLYAEALEEMENEEIIEVEQSEEEYSAKTIYEGCYFDEGVYQYWTSMPLSESPMI